MINLSTTIKELENKGFEFVKSYFSGEEGYWGFNKERDVEIILKINEMPDEENIENFEEHLKEQINDEEHGEVGNN